MTQEEKLEKAVKLADAMYYAAQMITTDASHLRKATEAWWNFKNVELKESEDERIRKEIYQFVYEQRPEKEWIAWLEKQGEQKPTDKVEPKFKIGDKVIGIVSDMQYYITDVCYDHYYTESGCIIMFCSQDNFKLVEQKPAWSEEDEKIALSIEQVMNCASLLNIVPNKIERIRTWLKTLKQRII